MHRSTCEALIDRAEFYTMRERLRHLARTRLRVIDPHWPAEASSEDRLLLKKYRTALRNWDPTKAWPIDLDSAARCTLLLDGAADLKVLMRARTYLNQVWERFQAVEQERAHSKNNLHPARYINTFELDCLRTTEILVCLAEGRVGDARRAFDEYGSVALKTRRRSQRVARRLRLMVEAAEAARKSAEATPQP